MVVGGGGVVVVPAVMVAVAMVAVGGTWGMVFVFANERHPESRRVFAWLGTWKHVCNPGDPIQKLD